MRVVIVTGPWQVVTAASAMISAAKVPTLLVVTAPGQKEAVQRAASEVAAATGQFDRIEVHDRPSMIPDLAKASELWICRYRSERQALVRVLPRCRAVLFEDGLHNYQPDVLPWPWRRVARALASPFVSRHRSARGSGYWLSKTDEARLVLPPLLGWPKLGGGTVRHLVAPGSVVDVLDRVSNGLGVSSLPPNAYILLGDNDNAAPEFERPDWAAQYARLLDLAAASGRPVFWKAHPRSSDELTRRVLEQAPGVRSMPSRLPVELFVPPDGDVEVASASSTSLLYLHHLGLARPVRLPAMKPGDGELFDRAGIPG